MNTTVDPPSGRSRRLKILLILDTVGTILLTPIAAFWGLMSGMSTTTTTNADWANFYVLVNLALPVVMVLSLIGAWIAFAMRRERIAWVVMFLPLIPFVISLAMLISWPAT